MRKIAQFLTLLLGIACLAACTQEEKVNIVEEEISVMDSILIGKSIREVLTKTYKVKEVDGQPAKDALLHSESKVYSPDGKKMMHTVFTLEGEEVVWQEIFEYRGDTLVGSQYFEGDKQKTFTKIDLDEQGRKIKSSTYSFENQELLNETVFQYLENGQLRREGFINENGNFVWDYEYELTEKGLELRSTYQDLSTGKTYPTIFQYTTFNQAGDWTQKWLVENELVTGIEEREMDYYE